MNKELDELTATTMGLIAKRAQENDLGAVTTLSDLAGQINQLRHNWESIRADFGRVTEIVERFKNNQDLPHGSNGARRIRALEMAPREEEEEVDQKSRARRISIEVDWSLLGGNGQETIAERLASNSLEKFLRKLAIIAGIGVLEKLTKFSISRGPLVSINPRSDFQNQKQGSLYAYARIGATDYYVLTHSGTSEKVQDIKNAVAFLKLPAGAVRVSDVPK